MYDMNVDGGGPVRDGTVGISNEVAVFSTESHFAHATIAYAW